MCCLYDAFLLIVFAYSSCRQGVKAALLYLQVSQWYDLVVFTASMEIYGAAVADKLDNSNGILKRRYYRQVSIMHFYFNSISKIS